MIKKTSEADVGIDLNNSIEKVNIDVLDPKLKTLISLLINKIEELEKTIKELRVENQKLRDENNRIKGERGKPTPAPKFSINVTGKLMVSRNSEEQANGTSRRWE